ncbi:unnamed protein product, partial [marine sediment metagenome]
GIANTLSLFGKIYSSEGKYDLAVKYCKESLSLNRENNRDRIDVLNTLAEIYYFKNELNRAVKYQKQAVAIAEEIKMTDAIARNLLTLAKFYRVKGDNDLVINYAEQCLILSEKWGLTHWMAQSLMILIGTYIDEKSREKADRYFSRLTELHNQAKEKGDWDFPQAFLASKAYIMKSSTRMRDRVEAQSIFKELINRGRSIYFGEEGLIFNLISLSDLLLEELSIYNDLEILDEVNSCITKILEIAEKENNYFW